MAVNFPDAPSNGDSFSVNDTTYVYNATAGYWDITSTVQASASTGTNAPSNPSAGDFWFDPSSLTTYIYYSDGTSSQWIPANSVGARGAPGPGYPTSYYSVDYTSTTTGNVVFNSSSTPTLPSYTVGKVNAWVNGVLRSDIDATDGSNVEISLSTGDEVQIINFGDTDVLDPTASSNDHTTYTTLSSLIDTVQSNVTSAGSGVAVYATPDLLPLTGTDAGEQAYVNSTNRLYINNGTGWYSIGLVNSSPTITSVLDGDSNNTPFTLSTDGSSSIITITASDPEDIPLTYNYSVTSGTLTNGGGTTATVVQGTGSNTNQFTITPSTTEAYAGTFELTFTASDGINTATNVNSFTLQFSVNWSTGGSLEHTITGLSSAGWDANLSMDATGERLFIREYESSSVFALGIYKRTGSSWALEQEFTDPTDSQIQYSPGSHLFKIGENGDWVAWNRAPSNAGIQNRITFARRSGTTWTTEQVGDGNNSYWFISGDGNHVFNAYPSDTTSILWRFQYSGGTWSQNNITSMSLPGVGYRRSGGSNYDGTEIILGNYSTDTAYRCSVSGSTVTVQETLTGDSGKLFPFYENSAGNSIVYSKNGLTLAIYQRYTGTASGSTRNGKIFIYRRSSTSNNFGSAAVTYSGTSVANNYLGSQLSISDDGLFVAFGEDNDNNVFVAELNTGTGNWTKHTVNIPAGEGGSTYVTMSADASRIAYWGGPLSPSSSNKLFIYKA